RIPIYADSMVVVLRYDPLSSTYRTETIPLPGSFDVAVFKDDQFSCTAYLAARIDADSLQHSVDLGEVNYFYTRAAFFDGEWNAERRYADTLWTSEVPLSRDGQTRYYYVGRKVTLPFDTYHLAYAFEDQKGNARALFKGVSDSFRFVEGELAISDILFQDPSRLHPLSFERGGKTIYPHPGRRYKNGQRLGIYFEVYGLELSRRKSDFDVTFYIYEAPEETPSRWAELGSRFADIVGLGEDRAPAVSQTFRRQGVERTAVEEILIDVDALRPGRYEMVISIHDRVADEVEQASGYFFKVR
ncbi:MAG: hypothetical protein PVF33_12455, partial [Candidatus Latescibacterota bacterium]